MQNDIFQKKVEHYLKEHKRNKRIQCLLFILSVLTVASVYGVLCLPAVSMTKGEPRLEAETVRAVFGDELSFQVKAEAPEGNHPYVFMLHTESNGAGILDLFRSEEEDVFLIDTEEGGTIELHRKLKGDGIVNYWFSLEPEECASFTLYCNSDLYDLMVEESSGITPAEATPAEATPAEATPAEATPSEAALSEATPSEATPSEATPSEAEEAKGKQYLRIYGGCGKSLSSALRAAGKEDNSLELIWSEELKEMTFNAVTESGVTVTMAGPEDSFPEGDLHLVVKEVPDVAAPSSQYLFDICIMDGDKEVQPLGPVTITFEGLVKDAENTITSVYHVDDDKKEDMDAWTEEDGKIVMRTNHFSVYMVTVTPKENSLTLEGVLDKLGIANQFGVFANYMEAQGHMEGSVAVQEIKLTGANFEIGNTSSVGGIYGQGKSLVIRITKEIEGLTPEQIYYFGIFNSQTNELVEELSVTGEGSVESQKLAPGTYYVRELKEDGSILEQGHGDGFTVSYDDINLNKKIGGDVNNNSYIERFNPDTGITQMKVGQMESSTLFVGKDNGFGTNNNKETTIITPSGYTVDLQNSRYVLVKKPVNIDWESEFERLSDFSRSLGAYTANYNKSDTASPGVKVLQIRVPQSGEVNKALIAKSIGDSDANLNNGLPLGKNQYLIINLDCSDVTDKVWMSRIIQAGWSADNSDKAYKSRIIWNFTAGEGCYTGTVGMREEAGGTILLPQGTFEQSGTLDGSVIADKVIRTSNEIHQISFRLNDYIQTTVTNTYAPDTGRSLEIIKSDEDGALLEGTGFALYTSDENWKQEAVFAEKMADKDGKLIFESLKPGNYLLYETKTLDGYIIPASPWKITVTGEAITFVGNLEDVQMNEISGGTSDTKMSSCTIKNKKTGKVTIRAVKEWAGDGDGADRPKEVAVKLLKDGNLFETVILNEANEWMHEWSGLPKTDGNGVEIAYTVEETAVEGYKTTITRSQENGTENALTQVVSFSIINTKEADIVDNPEFTLEHKKTIDAFRDGDDNLDTTLDNRSSENLDLYRLYLDISGSQKSTPVDLLFIIDNSASMVQADQDLGNQTRLNVLNSVLKEEDGFIDSFLNANPENRIAAVYFSGPSNETGEAPAFPASIPITVNGSDFYGDAWEGWEWSGINEIDEMKASLIASSLNGQAGTNYAAGLRKAADVLDRSDQDHLKHIVFLSGSVPTHYLKYRDGTSSLWGTVRGGTGAADQSNAAECINSTEAAITTFKERYDIPISTIGFGDDGDNLENRTEVLKALVNKGGSYYEASGTEGLRQVLETMSFYKVSHVSITDRISQYVEWYGSQPDVLVTVKDEAGHTVELWKGSGEGESGTIGYALPGNHTTQDGKETDMINSVIYTPVKDEAGTTGTVTVIFNPEYELDEHSTYTLSFNVKATENAYTEYTDNLTLNGDGYGGVKGDDGTDYEANETSSNLPGFHSNHSAEVNYVLDKISYKEPYDHPVIQVAPGGLKLRKVDVADEAKVLPGAEFDLYRPAETEEGGTLIPGTNGIYGIKINQTAFLTDESGEISVQNLVPSTYYLVETRAPSGYRLLEKAVSFTLTKNTVDVIGDGSDQGMVSGSTVGEGEIPVLTIKNTNGFEMPHTGGPGTFANTGMGLLLMVSPVLYYVKKRFIGFFK